MKNWEQEHYSWSPQKIPKKEWGLHIASRGSDFSESIFGETPPLLESVIESRRASLFHTGILLDPEKNNETHHSICPNILDPNTIPFIK